MYAVIMAGGGGTRLWPLSRVARPKPFLPLDDGDPLVRQTMLRLAPLVLPADVYVVTDTTYVELVRQQLPELPPENVLAEPTARNTAAAVALAAVAIERDPSEVMAVLPADHRITDASGFRAALAVAEVLATDGRLVTLGIEPTGPETGYGYIVAEADQPRAVDGRPTFSVSRFVEKPSAERAAELLAAGGASWNAGIFVWRRDAVIDGLTRHAADIVEPIREAISRGDDLDAAYRAVRATSIDFALLEPASLEGRVSVVPVDVGWSDIGSWSALHDALSAADGSRVVRRAGDGEAYDIGSSDVLVHASGGRIVVTIGLDGVIVVDTPDAVLVCSSDRVQDVKRIVDQLAADGRRDLL